MSDCVSSARYFSPHFASGASLVEVLVSLVIFGVSTLGLMNLQQRTLQYTESTYWQSQALSLARQWVERIALHPTAAADNQSVIQAQAEKILPSPKLALVNNQVRIAWLNDKNCSEHCVSLVFAR